MRNRNIHRDGTKPRKHEASERARSLNLLLRQAQDEMLSEQLEFGRLLRWLQSMPEREVVHCVLEKPSPLAFPLFVDRLRERLSSESIEDRLKRMAWA